MEDPILKITILKNSFHCATLGWLIGLVGLPSVLLGQNPLPVHIEEAEGGYERVMVAKLPFADFLWSDTMEKPVLFAIHAPNQQRITRGYPLAPEAGESTDHPHHVGLWFNYENVNGFDFWNNSFAIAADQKQHYGRIRVNKVTHEAMGSKARLHYQAFWETQSGEKLLEEHTSFTFSANASYRIIDRQTDLLALEDDSFPDAKDGMLGLRLTKALELPSAQPQQFTDAHGKVTEVARNRVSNGDYLTSEGKRGDSAWGTRARWCMIFGAKEKDTLSVVMVDHPSNPGYPTYWHARGYGLFAANPLGQKVFSKGALSMNFFLKKGSHVVFRYRIIVASGKKRLSPGTVEALARDFAKSSGS